MKHILAALAATAIFATSAHALSFQWSTKSVAFGSTSLKNSEAVTGYLIYLGNVNTSTTASLDSNGYSIATDTTGSSLASAIGSTVSTKSTPNAVGKLQETYKFTYGEVPGKNGDVFALLLSYVSEGTTYFNLSSTTITLSGLEDNTSAIANPDFTSGFSYADSGTAQKVSAGGGWVAVPEPSTAALALAGLALLLKRRKA